MTSGADLVNDEADFREVVNLPFRYARAMDDRNWEEFRSVFTTDAVADYEHRLIRGGDLITAEVRPLIEATSLTHHMMTNQLVTLSGLTGTVEAYCRAFHQGKGSKSDQTFECLVRYWGEVTNGSGGWQISRWKERLNHSWGSMDVLTAPTEPNTG